MEPLVVVRVAGRGVFFRNDCTSVTRAQNTELSVSECQRGNTTRLPQLFFFPSRERVGVRTTASGPSARVKI